MLTVAEAAVYATVSERLIRQWITDGQLPVVRVGARNKRGHIRIQREDLDGLLASFKVTKKRPEPIKAPARNSFKHLKLS